MRRLLLLAIALILFTGNVKAADQYCATLVDKRENSITFNFLGDSKKLYVASLKDSSGKKINAFCLNPGWRIDTITPNAYVRMSAGSYNITARMRIVYNYAKDVNTNTTNGKFMYLMAQIAIWLDTVNPNSDITTFKNQFNATASNAIAAYFTTQGNDQEQINRISELFRKSFLNYLDNGTKNMYQGQLYVFEYKNGGKYQKFLTGLEGKPCPDTPPDTPPDIPPPNTCPDGFATTVVGNAPVCANDNQTHTGMFTEELDYNTCGNSNEYGTFQKDIGQYCKLYCRETVEMYFPGGISSPISLGTNIVWPTSSATEHTVWKNLYSLRYAGKKDCTLVISGADEIIQDYRTAAEFVRQHRQYDGERENSCASYNQAVSNANNALETANNNLSSTQEKLDEAAAAYISATENANYAAAAKKTFNACESNNEACYEANKNYGKCITSCQNGRNCSCKLPNCKIQECDLSAVDNYDQALKKLKQARDNVNNAQTEYKKANKTVESAYNTLENARTNLSNCNNYISYYNIAEKIVKELSDCANYPFVAEDLYHFESSTSVSYNDNEYGATYSLIGNTIYNCINCDGLNNSYTFSSGNINLNYVEEIIEAIGNRDISIDADVTYTLPIDGYRYISKKNNQPLKSPIGDVINVGYTFLPTSYNAKVNSPYNLNIIVNSLGENGKFTAAAQENMYTCNYSVMNAPTDECVCPDGTKHAGKDLFPYIGMASQTAYPMTCADAQLKYCDDPGETEDDRYFCPKPYENIEITSCINSGNSFENCLNNCSSSPLPDKYCPDGKTKITACLNNGNSYQYCVDNLCNSGTTSVDYHCPRGTFNDGMDIKPCVFANINMGLDQALQYCVDTVCPGGQRIIYRTISLRNPFPGKTAGLGVNNTTNLFSLDFNLGRYPGSNWNSQLLVERQILKNRNVEGNSVYQKEPLYSFILTPSVIKEIRKYNDTKEKLGGYADFTLDCNENGVACISSFIRDPKYGLVGGVCSSASKSNFYVCSES